MSGARVRVSRHEFGSGVWYAATIGAVDFYLTSGFARSEETARRVLRRKIARVLKALRGAR